MFNIVYCCPLTPSLGTPPVFPGMLASVRLSQFRPRHGRPHLRPTPDSITSAIFHFRSPHDCRGLCQPRQTVSPHSHNAAHMVGNQRQALALQAPPTRVPSSSSNSPSRTRTVDPVLGCPVPSINRSLWLLLPPCLPPPLPTVRYLDHCPISVGSVRLPVPGFPHQ
jgi:hypothetical protein